MADVTKVRAHHGTLSASAAQKVTLSEHFEHVEIVNRSGNAAIYVRLGGPEAAVAADENEVLPAAIGGLILRATKGGPVEVSLVSTGAEEYSVIGIASSSRDD